MRKHVLIALPTAFLLACAAESAPESAPPPEETLAPVPKISGPPQWVLDGAPKFSTAYLIETPTYNCGWTCWQKKDLVARPAIFGDFSPDAPSPCKRACFIANSVTCTADPVLDAAWDALPPKFGCPGDGRRNTCYPVVDTVVGDAIRVDIDGGACDLAQAQKDCDAYVSANYATLVGEVTLTSATPPNFTTSWAWCW